MELPLALKEMSKQGKKKKIITDIVIKPNFSY